MLTTVKSREWLCGCVLYNSPHFSPCSNFFQNKIFLIFTLLMFKLNVSLPALKQLSFTSI